MPHVQVRVFQDAQRRVPLKEWLDALELQEPAAHRKCLQRILWLGQFGSELRRPHAEYLRDDIYELRAPLNGIQWRMLYFFVGRSAAVVSHGLKKYRRVPGKEIELAIRTRQLVLLDFDRYTAEWPLD